MADPSGWFHIVSGGVQRNDGSKGTEMDYEGLKQKLMGELKQHFRPEFLNRIDEIIVFHALTKEQVTRIVDIMLDEVRHLLHAQNILLSVTDEAKHKLVETGYDPTFGARPLRREIQRQIENPLSMELLEGKIKGGDEITVTTSTKGEIVFKTRKAPAKKKLVSAKN